MLSAERNSNPGASLAGSREEAAIAALGCVFFVSPVFQVGASATKRPILRTLFRGWSDGGECYNRAASP